MSNQGCSTCKYEFEDAKKLPCVECYQNHLVSKWEPKADMNSNETSQVSVGGQVLNNVAQLSALGKQSTTFESKLDAELADLRAFLMSKNQAYGDSALNPVRVFSKSDSTEQLRVRIDDKISRLMRGAACGEDTIKDLTCYLILLRIAERVDV